MHRKDVASEASKKSASRIGKEQFPQATIALDASTSLSFHAIATQMGSAPGQILHVWQVGSDGSFLRCAPAIFDKPIDAALFVRLQNREFDELDCRAHKTKVGAGDLAIRLHRETQIITKEESADDCTLLVLPISLAKPFETRLSSTAWMEIPEDHEASKPLRAAIEIARMFDHATPPNLRRRFAQLLMESLEFALTQTDACNSRPISHLHRYHLARIKEYVRHNIHDADLSAGSIAKSVAMSRSHLHKIFRDEGCSLMTWIWNERLHACHEDLAASANSIVSISEIAQRHGFKDSSHFSRAFSRKFGISPRAWRSHFR